MTSHRWLLWRVSMTHAVNPTGFESLTTWRALNIFFLNNSRLTDLGLKIGGQYTGDRLRATLLLENEGTKELLDMQK